MIENAQNSVVIDPGSGMIKAGFAFEELPSAYFQNIIGRPKYGVSISSDHSKEYMIGDEAAENRSMQSVSKPVNRGIIENWDDCMKIWDFIYKDYIYKNMATIKKEEKLPNIENKETIEMPDINNQQIEDKDIILPVHFCEVPFNPAPNREKSCEIFFENYKVPAFHLSAAPQMSLYASGRITGLVQECGDGVTYTTAIIDGTMIKHASQQVNLGGRDLTTYLGDILNEAGVSLTSSTEVDIVRKIKENSCYMSQEFEYEKMLYEQDDKKDKEYELPDGITIRIGSQQIRCPEVLFKHSQVGREPNSIDKMVCNNIQSVEMDLRRDQYSNILLSGGSTLFEGLPQRLIREVKTIAYNMPNIECKKPLERKYSVWQGAACLCTLASFQDMWITKKEYDESGASIVLKKCN